MGSQPAALYAGGNVPGGTTGVNESWDGTSWAETNNLNTARGECGSSGTQALGLVYGGTPESDPTPTSVKTDSWDGTSWTEVGDLASTRTGLSGSPQGTNTLALAMAGDPAMTNTEEWNAETLSVKTVTVS